MHFIPRILLIGLVALLTLFTPLYGQKTTDDEQVKKVIVDAFQALADIDMTTFRSHCQPDFVLLENGEIWSADTLEARMKPYIGSGMKRVNTLDFVKTTVKGNTAWVTYQNRADIAVNGQNRTLRWLESAVLEKEKKVWKLALLHSTVLPKKN